MMTTTESILADLLARGDDDLTVWAVEWLGLPIDELWDDLDGDERDALVAAGVVTSVTCDAECTDAESWSYNWQSECHAAWPKYTLTVTAAGLPPFEVTGWHLVGPPVFRHRRVEPWGVEDSDGYYSGHPWVDEYGREYRGGSDVDDRCRPIPCWRHEGRWVTIDPSSLDSKFRSAASCADHGDEPIWEDVTEKDSVSEETLFVIRGGRVEELTLWRGGLAGLDNGKYWAEAWGVSGQEETFETRADAIANLAGNTDNGEVYEEDAEAVTAIGRAVA